MVISLIAMFWYQHKEAFLGKFSFNDSEQNIEEPNLKLILPEPTLTLPNWYIHYQNNGNIIYTRTKELPTIGDSEGYAYGEQINVSVMKFDGTEYKPEEWEPISWVNDEAMVREYEWTELYDFTVLRIRHMAGGADGESVTVYLFAKDRVYNISVYPVDEKNEHEFMEFVHQYAKQFYDELQ